MIGKLTGNVDSVAEDALILDVQGVGYQVHVPPRLLQRFSAAGERTTLFIETFVREDQIRLFGFSSAYERGWFRLLMRVQGVGTRVALAILGSVKPFELADAVAVGDKTPLLRAPGVGKKLAERLLAELKDKLSSLPIPDGTLHSARGTQDARSVQEDSLSEESAEKGAEGQDGREAWAQGRDEEKEALIGDAASALIHLGYDPTRAASVTRGGARQLMALGLELSTQTLIRYSLKELSR